MSYILKMSVSCMPMVNTYCFADLFIVVATVIVVFTIALLIVKPCAFVPELLVFLHKGHAPKFVQSNSRHLHRLIIETA